MFTLGAIGLIASLALAGRKSEEGGSAPALPFDSPAPRRTAQHGSEVLGINEAVSIPEAFIRRGQLSPEDEARLLSLDAIAARALGAKLVRSNTAVYPYLDQRRLAGKDFDWSRADRWVGAVQAEGLDPILMLGPWPGNRTASFTDHYLPDDLDAYDRYLARVVERYDGDGVEDMPGLLRPIHTYEVDNEPDLHHTAPPSDAPRSKPTGDFETPAEYAQLLVRSSAAIHAADPEAFVLSGGMYRPHTAPGRAYLQAVLDWPGALAAIDGLSLHCYLDEDGLDHVTATLATARELAPGLPLWITETGVPADGRKPWVNEEWQARMVSAVIGAFLAGGADRVLWHTLADPPAGSPAAAHGGFSTHSLLRASAEPGQGSGRFERKPAGEVFARLAAALAPTDPSSYRELPGSGGRLLSTDQGILAFWGQPAWPEGAEKAIDLRTGEPLAPDQPLPAPAWLPFGG